MNLLLEGDDLEALLLRAHREGGTAARIVRAEKIRRGGILGFFAKEGFEVAVEIPQDAQAAAATASTAAAIEAGTPLESNGLADQTSAAERAAALAITQQEAYDAALRAATAREGRPDPESSEPDDALPTGASPAERLAAKLMSGRKPALVVVEPTVVESRFVEPRVVEADFALAEVVEMLATEQTGPARGTAIQASPERLVVPSVAFTVIDFPHVTFPEDGAGSASGSLNEASQRTDLSEVTDPSADGNEPLTSADAAETADSSLWFDTQAATSPGLAAIPGQPTAEQSRIPGRVSQLRQAVTGRHQSPAFSEPGRSTAAPAHHKAADDQPEAQSLARMPLADQALKPVAPNRDLSPSGGRSARTTGSLPRPTAAEPLATGTLNRLAANSTARATTVVPRARTRRGGHQALPAQRSGERQELHDPPKNSTQDNQDDHRSVDTGPTPRSGQHAATWDTTDPARGHQGMEPEPGGEPTNSESAWRLLRRRRPGLRKQTAAAGSTWTPVDDADPEHFQRLAEPTVAPPAPTTVHPLIEVPTPTQTEPTESTESTESTGLTEPIPPIGPIPPIAPTEIPDLRWVSDEVAGGGNSPVEEYGTWISIPKPIEAPFAYAATLGDVPAGSDVIEGFDQLTADREALQFLGVPVAWTKNLHAGDRFGSIVAMLDQLAEPRIREDAAVIAVVGPADVVELEAHHTALDLPASGRPRAVTLVSGAVGVDRRAAIARSKRIRPVVISVPIDGYDDPAGTRKVLTSINAEAVIVVVDASRPLDEITAWVQALEQVDAIALDGALAVDNPAAVLGLDVPVIRVDGIAMDRIGWAALLCAQLAALDASR